MQILRKTGKVLFKAKCRFESFLIDEKGDTNFISILIILGIVLLLAGVFLVFKDQIVTWVGTQVTKFFSNPGLN